MNLITRVKEDFIVYREKLRRKLNNDSQLPHGVNTFTNSKYFKRRIAILILIPIIIFALIYGIRRLVEKNTSTSDAINAVVMEDGQKLNGSFFYNHELSKGDNVYILDSFIESGEVKYKVKYDDHIGTISSQNIKYYSQDTKSEYTIMSDVSHFVQQSNFKTENDFEVFLLKNNFNYVYIRAGGRGYGADGNFYFDKEYELFINACEYLKIPYGFYFLDEALSEEEADEEVEWIKDFIKENGKTYNILPVAIDIEYFDGKGRGDDKWQERASLIEYLGNRLDENYIENIIYANANRASQFLSNIDNEFWLAYYPSMYNIPDIWINQVDNQDFAKNEVLMSKTIAWQFTEEGASMSGIDIEVDVNKVKNEFFKNCTKAE